jgi:hypothetical protein
MTEIRATRKPVCIHVVLVNLADLIFVFEFIYALQKVYIPNTFW